MFCILLCSMLVERPAHAGATPWIDFELHNGHILIESEIAGIAGYTLIDTGAEVNAINGRFLAAFDLSFEKGRPVTIRGAFGTAERNVYREVPVTLFGMELKLADLVELSVGGEDMQVILGAGFLQFFIFQFDYPNQRLRMIERDTIDLKSLKNVPSQKSPQGGSPLVKVRLNDEVDVWLIMDTGANSGILLERSVAVKKKWLDRFPSEDSRSIGVNTGAVLEKFNLPILDFGGFEIENPIIRVPQKGDDLPLFEAQVSLGSRVPKSRKAKGLLGYDILKHFVVTVDYKSGYVHIAPGSPDQQGQ
jgi:predicted aspartyl protease